MVQRYRDNVREGMEADCAAQGVDINMYCMYNYGMDAETFLDQYAQEAAKQSLAFQAVANAENLNISDEELQETLEQYAAQGGYASVEEFLGELDREEYPVSLHHRLWNLLEHTACYQIIHHFALQCPLISTPRVALQIITYKLPHFLHCVDIVNPQPRHNFVTIFGRINKVHGYGKYHSLSCQLRVAVKSLALCRI